MTQQQFKEKFESLPIELQQKIRALTREAMIQAALSETKLFSDSEQAQLDSTFGPEWREYFLGKGIAFTK